MTPPTDTSFISKAVVEGSYYFLDLDPPAEAPLTVVCGGREVCGAAYRVDRETFRYSSVELVASGAGSVTLGSSSFALKPGTLFRYGPATPHHIEAAASSRMVKHFVDFVGTSVTGLFGRGAWAEGCPLRVAPPQRIEGLFEELLRIGQTPSPGASRRLALLVEEMILRVSDESVADDGLERGAWATYQRCRSEIERTALIGPSLTTVARTCGVSEAHICRLFQRFDRVSPHQHLLRVRMGRAAELLLDRVLLVKDFDQQVGFDDPYHFSRAFKRVYGLSPEAFRTRGPRS